MLDFRKSLSEFIVQRSAKYGDAPAWGRLRREKAKIQDHERKVRNMKPAGYWACRNEIVGALLPHWNEPFAEYFDAEKLAAVRDTYDDSLYETCRGDVLASAVKMGNITVHLMMCGVTCKPIFAQDDCHDDFIAVFGLGNLSERRISEIVKTGGSLCIFQRSYYEKYAARPAASAAASSASTRTQQKEDRT